MARVALEGPVFDVDAAQALFKQCFPTTLMEMRSSILHDEEKVFSWENIQRFEAKLKATNNNARVSEIYFYRDNLRFAALFLPERDRKSVTLLGGHRIWLV